jgi:acetyl-CoA C-acetyltransferase
VHGNGYYLTKHSVGLYSRRPPEEPPQPPEKLQEFVDGLSDALVVEPSAQPGATGVIVAYTAPFERDGSPGPAVALLDVEGRRTVARGDDALSAALLEHDGVGDSVVLGTSDEGNTMRAG